LVADRQKSLLVGCGGGRLKVLVKQIGKDKKESAIIHTYEINNEVKSIVVFI